MREHHIRFSERTLASVRCECVCGWKAEVLTKIPNRQEVLNGLVAEHLSSVTSTQSNTAAE